MPKKEQSKTKTNAETLADTWIQVSRSNTSPQLQNRNQTRVTHRPFAPSDGADRKIPPTLRDDLTTLVRPLWLAPHTRSRSSLARDRLGQDAVEPIPSSWVALSSNGGSGCLKPSRSVIWDPLRL